MSARRKQLIALSVVLVCVIGMAAYGIVRVSNKTADKENGFDVAMTDTTDKSEDGSKDSDKTEKKEKTDQKSDAKKDDSVKEDMQEFPVPKARKMDSWHIRRTTRSDGPALDGVSVGDGHRQQYRGSCRTAGLIMSIPEIHLI